MEQMYKALAHSPTAKLTESALSTDTTIKVDSVEGFLEAPNLAVISSGGNFETIRYGAIGELTLEQCERGFEGVAQNFFQGAKIARYYTAIEHNAIVENIEELYDTKVSLDETGVLPIEKGGTGNTVGQAVSANSLTTGRTIQTDLTLGTATVFDGTSNVVIGITGVLPVENGGTGSSTGSSGGSSDLIGETGENHTQLGVGTTAGSNNSVALGCNTIAGNVQSTAVGGRANANSYAVALGYGSTAGNGFSTAVGRSSIASGSGSLALGGGAVASGESSAAIGYGTIASGVNSTAVGRISNASGFRALGLGYLCTANGSVSMALGSNSIASHTYAIALGDSSVASNSYCIALGVYANSSGGDSIALGAGAKATGYSGIGLGVQSSGSGSHCVAIGTHSTASGIFSTALGTSSNVAGANSTAVGTNSSANGNDSIALGVNSVASSGYDTALGRNAIASGYCSTAVGESSSASGASSLALGRSSNASGAYSIALGYGSDTGGFNSTALGYAAAASGDYSTAVGYFAFVPSTSSNTMQLGDTTKLSTLSCKVALTVTSDERDKVDIEPVVNSLEFLSKIETVTYKFNHRSDYAPDIEEDIRSLEKKQEEYKEAQEKIKELEAISETIEDRETGETIPNPSYNASIASTISTYQLVSPLTEEEQSELEEKKARREKRNLYGLADYDKEEHTKGTKKRNRQRIGVLAQQVQSAMIAEYGTDDYADILINSMYGKDESEIPEGVENILGVNYSCFTPLLIDGVSRLYAYIQELEKRVEILEKQSTV